MDLSGKVLFFSFFKMLTSQKFPTPWPDKNPHVGEGTVPGFFSLTLPQWGLCDLIQIPPTPFGFEHSNTAVDGAQLAMTPKPQSVLRLRHRQGLTATVKQTSLCLKSSPLNQGRGVLSILAGYSIAVHIGLLCLTPLCCVQVHS